MFDISNFDDVFGFDSNYSYDEATVESIEQRRIAFEGLFVDRVLRLLSVKRRKYGFQYLIALLLIRCTSEQDLSSQKQC